MSRATTFYARLYARPAKTGSACASAQSEFLQCTLWVAERPKRFRANSEDSDKPARMRRLISVFAGRTCSRAGNAVSRLIKEPF